MNLKTINCSSAPFWVMWRRKMSLLTEKSLRLLELCFLNEDLVLAPVNQCLGWYCMVFYQNLTTVYRIVSFSNVSFEMYHFKLYHFLNFLINHSKSSLSFSLSLISRLFSIRCLFVSSSQIDSTKMFKTGKNEELCVLIHVIDEMWDGSHGTWV